MALVLALSLVPTAAFAAEGENVTVAEVPAQTPVAQAIAEDDVAAIGNVGYDTLAEAVAAAIVSEEKEIEIDLLKTTEGSGVKVTGDTGKKITIDLNQFTYTVVNPTVGSTGTETNGFQLLKGTDITFKNGTIKPGTSAAKILIQNYCNLILDNVNLDCSRGNCDYALSNNCGDTIIKENTNIIASSGKVAFDVCDFADYPSVSVTFDNSFSGKVDGTIEYTGTDASLHRLTINGNGTFTGEILATESYAEAAEDAINITGGTFTNESARETIDRYIVDGAKLDENGTVIADTEDMAAVVDERGYKTIQEAVAALKDNSVMKIIADVDVTTNRAEGTFGSCFVITKNNVTITAYDEDDLPTIYGFSNKFNDGIEEGLNGQSTIYVTGENVTLENLILMPLGGISNGPDKAPDWQKTVGVTSTATGFAIRNCTTKPNTMPYSGEETASNSMADSAGFIHISNNSSTLAGNSFGTGTTVAAGWRGSTVDEGYYTVDAFDNFWGDNATAESISQMIEGNINIGTYYTDSGKTVTATIGGVLVSNEDELRSAINNATDGDTIVLADNITINTALEITKNITINGNDHTITAKGAALYIKENLESLTVHNLTLKGAELGENQKAGEGNDAESGPWMGIGTYNGGYGVTELTLTDVTIDGFSYGLYFGADTGKKASVSIDADGLQIKNSYIKGAYFENLTNSTFNDCEFTDNGTDETKVVENFTEWMSGVDINLKYGEYENIIFDGCTFVSNGDNSGTALHIKARGTGKDTSYEGNPATLTGVTVTNCTFTNNNKPNGEDKPIVIGEPGKENTSPTNIYIQPDVSYTNNLADTSYVTVTLDANGGTCDVKSVIVKNGGTIGNLPTPTWTGYDFQGWYNGNVLVSAGDTVTNNMTLVAHWTAIPTTTPSTPSSGSSEPSYSPVLDISDGGTVKVNPRTPSEGDEVTITVDPDRGYEVGDVTVTDRNGREVDVTAERNGTYTFEQPRGRVTIEVTFVPTGTVTFFTDVPESFWAYDEIKWAYDNGYVNGATATTFSPNGSITRQQVWMILARLSGADPANMAAARTWAIDNGISDGTNPGSAVTRQQLVALLYRYATLMGYANDARADLSVYPDAGTVASYAVEPMQWSVANNIVAGTSDGILNPTGTATRAQFAVILYRFMA